MNVQSLSALLGGNPYPGRGIVLGRSEDNTKALIAYFIMGRSENSRNRVFVETEDGIRTEAFDPSKMTDPSLIIYHPVRAVGRGTVVTNGDQTDTIRDYLVGGRTMAEALHTREFEPDAPNYTPRISGLLSPDGSYKLSILKSMGGDPSGCQRFFFEYEKPAAGVGHFIHTYQGDGAPLPSFQGEPVAVALKGGVEELTQEIWSGLNTDNKVSLFVRSVDLRTGKTETKICNKHQ